MIVPRDLRLVGADELTPLALCTRGWRLGADSDLTESVSLTEGTSLRYARHASVPDSRAAVLRSSNPDASDSLRVGVGRWTRLSLDLAACLDDSM